MGKAIVTGASRGIGRGIALELAKRGYDLAISYNEMEEDAKTLAWEIKNEYGRECYYFQASLHLPGEGVRLFESCVEKLKGVDLLVNNAGLTRMEGILDLTEETMDFLINLDFRNYLIMAREAARYMVKNNIRGSIINITSSRGERAYPGDMVYGALKAGLERGIQSAALDLAPYGIRINNVAPGATRVRDKGINKLHEASEKDFWEELGPRIPLERVGTPQDIGKAVAYLASEDASYITGVTLRVDGGLILAGMPERPIAQDVERGWGFKEQKFAAEIRAESETDRR